jgi:hypothetical protein
LTLRIRSINAAADGIASDLGVNIGHRRFEGFAVEIARDRHPGAPVEIDGAGAFVVTAVRSNAANMVRVRERSARVYTGNLSAWSNKVCGGKKRFSAISRLVFKAQIHAGRRLAGYDVRAVPGRPFADQHRDCDRG